MQNLPSVIYEHRITREKPGLVDFDVAKLPYPGIWLSDLALLTFADAGDFKQYLAPKVFIDKSREIRLAACGKSPLLGVQTCDLRNVWDV